MLNGCPILQGVADFLDEARKLFEKLNSAAAWTVHGFVSRMARKPLPDHYGVLEIREDADELTIKKAYRRLVLQWHPDRNPADRETAEDCGETAEHSPEGGGGEEPSGYASAQIGKCLEHVSVEEKIRLLNIAYETVTNPIKRETYDLQRHAASRKRKASAPRSAPRVEVPKEPGAYSAVLRRDLF
eukprot:s810_g23.t1